jgi:hypothetical protein
MKFKNLTRNIDFNFILKFTVSLGILTIGLISFNLIKSDSYSYVAIKDLKRGEILKKEYFTQVNEIKGFKFSSEIDGLFLKENLSSNELLTYNSISKDEVSSNQGKSIIGITVEIDERIENMVNSNEFCNLLIYEKDKKEMHIVENLYIDSIVKINSGYGSSKANAYIYVNDTQRDYIFSMKSNSIFELSFKE